MSSNRPLLLSNLRGVLRNSSNRSYHFSRLYDRAFIQRSHFKNKFVLTKPLTKSRVSLGTRVCVCVCVCVCMCHKPSRYKRCPPACTFATRVIAHDQRVSFRGATTQFVTHCRRGYVGSSEKKQRESHFDLSI